VLGYAERTIDSYGRRRGWATLLAAARSQSVACKDASTGPLAMAGNVARERNRPIPTY
jgi:hypothetical protein